MEERHGAEGGAASGMAGHHAAKRWVHGVVLAVAAWLATSPLTMGYRTEALAWSDLVSAGLLALTSAAGLRVRGQWPTYASATIGLWLLFAPIAFWARTPAEYANGTLAGVLVVTFAILIPHGMRMSGPDVPRGWSYNPSSWPQRAPIIALGLVGFFLSRGMAAYQLGHAGPPWDPFFGDGTARVLDSEVSRMFPVSDAGLGATAYLIEVLMGFMGDERRWRTMPWMVAFFGILVVPLGAVSVVLIILQPVAVGAWCGPCLVAGAAMLLMIPLTVDEVAAMIQYLARERRAGRPVWRTFWLGGGAEDAPSPAVKRTEWSWRGMTWGVAIPPGLVAAVAAGVWLMAAPALTGASGAASDSDRLMGALVVTVSAIAMADVARPLRVLNLPLAGWLLVAPWVLDGAPAAAGLSDVAAALTILAGSAFPGRIGERYGEIGPGLRRVLPHARGPTRA